jgi:hypothetical protein
MNALRERLDTMQSCVKTVAFAPLMIAMTFLGCAGRNEESSASVSFVTKYAPIEFSFPSGWHVNTEENPFDLQCFSKFQTMNTGVFAFKKIDIGADSTPLEIFWEQIDDLKAKRSNFKELEPILKREHDEKTVTSITYTADKDSSAYCYRFSLIEFRTDDSKFAVVLQVTTPEEWKRNKSMLAAITESAKSLPDGEQPEQ